MKRKRLHGTPELLGRGGLQKLAQLVDMLRLEVEQVLNVFDAVLVIERPEQVATLDGAEPGRCNALYARGLSLQLGHIRARFTCLNRL